MVFRKSDKALANLQNLQFKQWLKQGETPESVTKGNFDERGTGVVLSCYDFNKANS